MLARAFFVRPQLLKAVVAVAATTALSLGGSAANAATTVTPNPVSPSGFITINPDSACTTSVGKLAGGTTVWDLLNSNQQSVNSVTFQPNPVALQVGTSPGSFQLAAYYATSNSIVAIAACGQFTVVVAAGGNVPVVDPKVGFAAGALGLGAIVMVRRRRRSGSSTRA